MKLLSDARPPCDAPIGIAPPARKWDAALGARTDEGIGSREVPSSIHARANRIVTEGTGPHTVACDVNGSSGSHARHTMQAPLRPRGRATVAASWTSSTSSERDEAGFDAD